MWEEGSNVIEPNQRILTMYHTTTPKLVHTSI